MANGNGKRKPTPLPGDLNVVAERVHAITGSLINPAYDLSDIALAALAETADMRHLAGQMMERAHTFHTVVKSMVMTGVIDLPQLAKDVQKFGTEMTGIEESLEGLKRDDPASFEPHLEEFAKDIGMEGENGGQD